MVDWDAINEGVLAFKKDMAKALRSAALHAYLRGDIAAHYMMRVKVDPTIVQRAALSFSEQYGRTLIDEGGSIINGKLKPWLEDYTTQTRIQIEQIVRDGINSGTPTGVKERVSGGYTQGTIADQLSTYFDDRRSHATMVARTEVARVKNLAAIERYKSRGYEMLECLDDEGPNSCETCALKNHMRATPDEAAMDELEHPNCVRVWIPIVEGFFSKEVEQIIKEVWGQEENGCHQGDTSPPSKKSS